MTGTVVEVGPTSVRGPNDVSDEWVSVALECIDDDIALVDERPLPVQDLWQDVIRAAAGEQPGTLLVICPTWWPQTRTDRIREAAQTVTETVVILQRTALLCALAAPRRPTIVELAGDLVVVTPPNARAIVVAHHGDAATTAEAVAAAVGGTSSAVLIDGQDAVIVDRLRRNGIEVLEIDEDALRREALRSRRSADAVPHVSAARGRRPRAAAILVGVAAVAGLAVHDGTAGGSPTTLLVEGGVGMVVPTDWAVQHVTSGPGSARVRIASPARGDVAVHLTQSTGLPDQRLEATAASLRAALDDETPGVFVDFNAADQRGDRNAVTYREIRPDHTVAWAVLVDGSVRIAIGCQSPTGQENLVREACEQAIRSARAVH
ncbi:type VII secretion-associated protein [Mycolicibacterium pulveris]|uniref:type VII secretion-associated protein n=1 Tax=Mycolicibacterium pulveris TaxID=36813 RepID=UPI003CEC26C1